MFAWEENKTMLGKFGFVSKQEMLGYTCVRFLTLSKTI